ncbi:hypothetical protein, partial [Streptomyces sp. NPDC058398]|uniref:hypothetical protein n=1 Tax=Streptomyces sp. NPDC058398 TaxID=3346479 RepID=UPI0036480756
MAECPAAGARRAGVGRSAVLRQVGEGEQEERVATTLPVRLVPAVRPAVGLPGAARQAGEGGGLGGGQRSDLDPLGRAGRGGPAAGREHPQPREPGA